MNEDLILPVTFGDVEGDVIVPSMIYQIYLINGIWGKDDFVSPPSSDDEEEDPVPVVDQVKITEGLGFIRLEPIGEGLDDSLSWIWNFTLSGNTLWEKTAIGPSLMISHEDLVLYKSASSISLVVIEAESDKASQEFIIK